MAGKDPWRGHRMLTQAEWEAKNAPPPAERADDTEVMRLWREAGLPEYFLGNGGTNHRLVKFAELIRAHGVTASQPVAPFGTNVPELLAAADALLRTAPPQPDWVEEVRELLGEAYRFQSTSPKAQENINAALELIDQHAHGVGGRDD